MPSVRGFVRQPAAGFLVTDPSAEMAAAGIGEDRGWAVDISRSVAFGEPPWSSGNVRGASHGSAAPICRLGVSD
jgi:hypothetical protein